MINFDQNTKKFNIELCIIFSCFLQAPEETTQISSGTLPNLLKEIPTFDGFLPDDYVETRKTSSSEEEYAGEEDENLNAARQWAKSYLGIKSSPRGWNMRGVVYEI